MDTTRETNRVLKLLRDLIEDSDLPRGEIEQRVGLSRGYLGQILNGRVELKLWHLIGLLEALGRNPAEFFSEIFPRRESAQRRAAPRRLGPRRAGEERRPATIRAAPGGRGPRAAADLVVNKDIVRVYSMGIESVRELRKRLERCEQALADLKESGWLDELLKETE